LSATGKIAISQSLTSRRVGRIDGRFLHFVVQVLFGPVVMDQPTCDRSER